MRVLTDVRTLRLIIPVVVAACSGTETTPLDLAGPPAGVTYVRGDRQAGATGSLLPTPLEVRVTDDDGRPVPAVGVTWVAQRGSVQVVNDSTDEDGRSVVRWRLPATTGQDFVVAAVAGIGAVTFTADVQPVPGTIVYRYVDAGSYHACGITTTEELICWGYGADGQLGIGSTAPQLFPTLIQTDLRFRAVSGGRHHACAVTLGYESYCWGSNRDGRVGSGDPQANAPVEVAEPVLFQSIQAGLVHTCAVSLSREIWCWGYNGEGEIGIDPVIVPGSVSPPARVGAGFRTVALGGLHTCAIAESGAASCWGFNAEGQLGDGGSTSSGIPTAVSGGLTFNTDPILVPPSPDPDFPLPDGPFIAAGYEHTCALLTTGSARCWGLNQDGQLGDGTTALRRTPAAVGGGLTFARITAGRQHSCAITSDGTAYCWGDNTFGQLGDGTTTDRLAPTAVAGGLTFAHLKAGDLSTCGVTTTGVAYCWGNNEYGQLGDGTTVSAAQPVKVSFQP